MTRGDSMARKYTLIVWCTAKVDALLHVYKKLCRCCCLCFCMDIQRDLPLSHINRPRILRLIKVTKWPLKVRRIANLLWTDNQLSKPLLLIVKDYYWWWYFIQCAFPPCLLSFKIKVIDFMLVNWLTQIWLIESS